MSTEATNSERHANFDVQKLSHKTIDDSSGAIVDYVDLKRLPQFGILSKQISSVVKSSSWWDLYGVDCAIHVTGFLGWLFSLTLLSSSNSAIFIFGLITLGMCHSVLSIKAFHSAVHDALCVSRRWNRFWGFFVSDFLNGFSNDLGYDSHVKIHHPHTNIIGLGDSSTWRQPMIPSFLYMFFTPLFVPILAPIVSLKELLSTRPVLHSVRFIALAVAGLCTQLYLMDRVACLSVKTAFLVLFVSRNVLSIPYIHINIFQHIGLPMYVQTHRPKKVYQMTTGVLNLPRNPILDYCFGHGVISCHTEHHLFPRLSDHMCLKIHTIVKRFCLEHDLPYHEDSYIGRLKHFLVNYQTLMVDTPPVTKFVGLQ